MYCFDNPHIVVKLVMARTVTPNSKRGGTGTYLRNIHWEMIASAKTSENYLTTADFTNSFENELPDHLGHISVPHSFNWREESAKFVPLKRTQT